MDAKEERLSRRIDITQTFGHVVLDFLILLVIDDPLIGCGALNVELLIFLIKRYIRPRHLVSVTYQSARVGTCSFKLGVCTVRRLKLFGVRIV
jgi:hypothetical protein